MLCSYLNSCLQIVRTDRCLAPERTPWVKHRSIRSQLWWSKLVPVQLKIEFWAKEKGMSCRRNYQEQDSEERTTELDGGREDTGVTPAFDQRKFLSRKSVTKRR